MPTRKGSSMPLSAIVLVVLANVLIPLAIGIFGKGFFPYKPLLPGLAQHEDQGDGPPPPAPFDRVVFMVVDALRSDFVYTANSGFEYTQSLIRSGAAVPFTAHATSPTVTMPRIKAITTGSTPSFLDVVLNVDEGDKSSSLASQDTWLAQLKAKAAGDLLLFGDDTWLKLFPDTFDRADGTSSFFVADFTEVDNNVTRHVADELRRDDWSLMVLHYLGLDHIGHKGGPRSPNMVPKQREMDAIVRQIYAALDSEPHLANTLLVLCGDHGMNDAGNHGASSAGETSPALVFAAPQLANQPLLRPPAGRAAPLDDHPDFRFYDTVEQSDLAPTLAALLGFPVPKNNLGAFIPAFLPLWPDRRHQTQTLLRNARQILGVLTAAFGEDAFALTEDASPGRCAAPRSDVDELACAWHTVVRTIPDAAADRALHDAWVERTIQWLRSAQQIMSGMASDYDMPMLGLGLGLAAAALALAVCASATILRTTAALRGDAGVDWRALVPFAGINIAYGVMMFASSYVEEEHHFWYWATTSWLAFASLRRMSALSSSPSPSSPTVGLFSSTAALVALRLIRAWNQTGQKFAGGPDLVKAFLVPNPALLWILVAATYLWCGARLVRGLLDSLAVVAPGPSEESPNAAIDVATVAAVAAMRVAELTVRVAVPILVFVAFLFKLVFALEDSPELVGSFVRPLLDLNLASIAGMTLITHARVVFAGLALVTAVLVYALVTERPLSSKRTALYALLPVYTLFGATQSRTTNIPLFLLFDIVRHHLHALLTTTAPARPGAGAPAAPRRLWAGVGPDLATATLLLQHTAFFAFGGTNAISSVDLSSAYNGISGFSAAAVGVLLFASNWAGALYWALAAVLLLVDGAMPAVSAGEAEAADAPALKTGADSPADTSAGPSPTAAEAANKNDSAAAEADAAPFLLYLALLSVFAAASTVAVMAACTALRTHLFVWTVFSPKYLYCAAWSLGMHLAVHVGLGGLLYRLGTWSVRRTNA